MAVAEFPDSISPNNFTNESLHLSADSASCKLLTGTNHNLRGFFHRVSYS